ncbi:branched-chain amino acid aminotransferase II [Lactarius deliciosus]|nr:branched-chain amino acid aminotransferase II [Lactarius deliciosus]
MTLQESVPLNASDISLPTAGAQASAQVLKNGPSSSPSDIDPSQLTITLAAALKQLSDPETLVFGEVMTDHMLYMDFTPERGWSPPQIKPYGPLSLDPACSCFQYCPSVFEGMKAYLGPDGTPRLFRPQLNMERMVRSAERVALPPFDADALLILIRRLVAIEARWIPRARGCSLYIRPTLIGTRPSLGVSASTHAALYVILSPTGPYIRDPNGKGLSLLAMSDQIRAWPGGTGGFKLGLNYAAGFPAQRVAAALGYQQMLWILGETIAEAGAMNVFAVFERPDGELDVVTPPLDGTILPGVTRASVLALLSHRPHTTALPQLSANCADPHRRARADHVDIVLPAAGEQGSLAQVLWKRLVDIQEGRVEWEGWGVTCGTSDIKR